MNIHELPTLKVDLKDNYVVEAVCKQLDDLILSFEIYNSYITIDLSSFDIELRALKSDKVPVIQDTDIVITNNKLKIKCNPQLTTSSGIVKAELQFIDKTTKQKKSSFNIEIDVKPSVLEVNRSISIPTFTAMERLEKDLDKVRDLEFNFNEADKLNRELKNTTIPTGNTLKTNLDNSISNGTTLKNDIDNRIVTGNKLKTDMDNSSTVATTKKEQLDGANVQAEKNIETLNSFGDASQLTKDVTTLKTKVLENTLTSIETDSILTKLDNCENGFVRNMQIRGRTLQNLIVKGNIVKEVKVSYETLAKYDYTYSLKQNTKYTVIFNSSKTTSKQVVINLNSGIAGAEIFTNSVTVGLNKITLDTGNYTELKSLWVYFKKDAGATESDFFNISDVMLLEGEPKEIPSYFEGIKSVGEAEDNKISILTKGKNLFNLDEAQLKSNTAIIKNTNSFILTGANAWCGTQQRIKLKPKTTYTLGGSIKKIKGGTNCYIQIKDNDKNVDYNRNYFNTFTTPSDISDNVWLYFVINTTAEDSSIEFSNIQLEEGTTVTAYEPYKEDKTEILLPSPHCGLPSGVSDVVDYDKNERIKNVDKVVLNGSENWQISSNAPIQTITVPFTLMLSNSVNAWNPFDNMLSDKFINKNTWNVDEEGISISTGNQLNIRILKSKLETPDVAGFKKWLQANPTTVYYQLANPVIEKLTIKDTLQTFTNGYIQLDNVITPCTQLEYSTNLPSALGGLTKVVDHNVDEITNIESTISDMDAEIGEARKDKETLNERLEDDRTNILKVIGNVNVETDGDIAKQLKEKVFKTYSNPQDYGVVLNKDTSINDICSKLPNYSILFMNTDWEECTTLLSQIPNRYMFLQVFKQGGARCNLRATMNNGTLYIASYHTVDNEFSGWKELSTVDDTGWIDISSTINSKAKGSARVRRISSQVFLEIQWMGVIPENETIVTMPSSYAPKGQSEYVFCRFAAGTITLCINGSGAIVMDYTNTGTQNNEVTCFARTSYLID